MKKCSTCGCYKNIGLFINKKKRELKNCNQCIKRKSKTPDKVIKTPDKVIETPDEVVKTPEKTEQITNENYHNY